MNGRDATAAVGGTAIGGDAALWMYDLLQWWLYSLPYTAMPEMPNTVAVGLSGGLLWGILWAASWLPRRPSPAAPGGSPQSTQAP